MFPYEDSKTVSVRPSVHLSVPREKKLPWLRQYQSYISNWYINGKVFTSNTPWKPKIKKKNTKSLKFEFWLVTKSWNHLSFVNISPILVIDTSMERSSQVLQHTNIEFQKFEFFQKSLKSNFDLYFDLCWIAEITLASSISVAHWQLIHQWKGLHEYYSTKTPKFDLKKNQNWILTYADELKLP